jgi:hypothetical protein
MNKDINRISWTLFPFVPALMVIAMGTIGQDWNLSFPALFGNPTYGVMLLPLMGCAIAVVGFFKVPGWWKLPLVGALVLNGVIAFLLAALAHGRIVW